jgi:DNA-directed RNA polymerase specialized sigma24 family protein
MEGTAETLEIRAGAFRALLGRDPDAAAALSFRLAQAAASRVAKRRGLSSEERDDVVSDVCAALWARRSSPLARLPSETVVFRWLCGVAEHKAVDGIADAVRGRSVAEVEAIRAEACAQRAERRRARWESFDRAERDALPPRQLRAIRLHVAGRTYPDIASELEVSEDRAADLVRLAWRRLEQPVLRALAGAHAPVPTVGSARISPRTLRIAVLWNSGRTRTEIASELGVPLSTVRGAIARRRTGGA